MAASLTIPLQTASRTRSLHRSAVGVRSKQSALTLCRNKPNSSMTLAANARIGLVAALCAAKLIAPYTYDETMNGVLFERCFEKTLLKLLPKKLVIITDNASFHKKEVLYQIAKKYLQALIFLQPFSLKSISLNIRGVL